MQRKKSGGKKNLLTRTLPTQRTDSARYADFILRVATEISVAFTLGVYLNAPYQMSLWNHVVGQNGFGRDRAVSQMQ
ncbi:hypothetical protein [Novipirellula caenicola]|uniref:hypothetical protein n=1 Tax=Novipirellula caenicola TaxID=1536901 RepID=UPI0031ED3190